MIEGGILKGGGNYGERRGYERTESKYLEGDNRSLWEKV